MILVDNKNKIELAMNTNSLNMMEKLALDDLKLVRAALTLNPNINQGLLEQLSYDNEFVVKCGVAENPKTSKLTLTYLMNQENDCLNFFILKNENCPKDIIEKLSQNDNLKISEKALDKLSKFDSKSRDTIDKVDSLNNTNESTNSNKHRFR